MHKYQLEIDYNCKLNLKKVLEPNNKMFLYFQNQSNNKLLSLQLYLLKYFKV